GVRQQFTQQERDIETGLDYFNARYYSSTAGRFTSVDPLLASARPTDPQSFNRFTYTRNNPLRFSDPTGLTTCCDDPDATPDYRPEYRPCTIGVDAGCSDMTVVGAVTITDNTQSTLKVEDLVMAGSITPKPTQPSSGSD